jgi:hypothetical protein
LIAASSFEHSGVGLNVFFVVVANLNVAKVAVTAAAPIKAQLQFGFSFLYIQGAPPLRGGQEGNLAYSLLLFLFLFLFFFF